MRRFSALLVGVFLVSACGAEGVPETAPLSVGEAQPSFSAAETVTAAEIAATGIVLEPDGLGIVRFGDPVDSAVEGLVDALGIPTLDESFTGEWPSSDVTTGRPDQGCTEATGYKCVDYLRRVAWERWGLAVVFSDVRGYSRSLTALVTEPHLVVWEHWVPEGGGGFTLASGVGPGSTVGDLRGHYEARQLVDMAIGCPGGDVDATGLNLDSGDIHVLPGNDTTSSTPLDASVEISFMWAGFHKECRYPHPFDGPRAGSLEAIGVVVSPACGYLADAWIEMAIHQARIQVPSQDKTRPPEPSVIDRLVELCPSAVEHTIPRICEQFTEATDPAVIAYRVEIYGDFYAKKQTDYHWRHATWTAAWFLATQNADSGPDAVSSWLNKTCAALSAPTSTTPHSSTTIPTIGSTTTIVAAAQPRRLLVDLPEWKVTRADESAVDFGGMTFSNGQYQLDLNWRPADSHERYVADRATSAKPPRQVTVYGQAAVQFLYDYVGSTDFTTLWLDGSHSFEARGVLPDRTSYEAVMAGLAPVDIDTWLNAMPESVVKPANRAPVIAAMLHDIPQPDSFDVAELTAAGVVRDRYQLGARVTGEIACQWIEQWLDARAVGDTAAASEAVDAMRTARNWSILIEMSESGAYHEVLWKYADIIASAGTADREVAITVQQSYQAALCHQRD